ncbi:hypothetical protein HELRODRAFT_79114 [Helobdella robusta]|uniref:RCC1-like G exchanging factor-like protein n=1 Tax=Helobdella robusta TaxID=6412 RepID=T1G3K3_HELRO|nr:hypothetical protein HELRODRAFT_79114 [Helobdella robusta]ESO04408.1 hypothetical protein HELRODRAFT_79114 [Helobdella robusta]
MNEGSELFRSNSNGDDDYDSDTVNQYAGKNLKRADRIYGWGSASTGALGVKTLVRPEKHQKTRKVQLTPLKIEIMAKRKLKVKAMGCGYGFTVFACEDGSTGQMHVYGTGLNTDSQIGYHEYPRRSGRVLELLIEPSEIQLPLQNRSTRITHVACGRAHTVIVTDGEGVFTLGNNSLGQCGRKIIESEIFRGSQLVNRIDFKEKIKQVVCGQDHTLLLTDDGRLFACGLSTDGQTGQGHYECVENFEEVVGDVKGEKIVQVSSKADTVLAVSEKGDLFGWGNNEYDQLEIVAPDETQLHTPRHVRLRPDVGPVKKTCTAGSTCAILNRKGLVYTWGYGILGRGPTVDRSAVPHVIPPILFGNTDYKTGDAAVTDLQCGLHFFTALTCSGDLYTWGRNRLACLGLGHVNDQYFPLKTHIPAEVKQVHCGVDHAVVLCKSFV